MFGSFDAVNITKENKKKKWMEIHEYGKSQGYSWLNSFKDYNGFRDKFWGNLKQQTMRKRDRKRPTGGSGGEEIIYTEVEERILDILGRNSAAVEGLDEEESALGDEGSSPRPRVVVASLQDTYTDCFIQDESDVPSTEQEMTPLNPTTPSTSSAKGPTPKGMQSKPKKALKR